MDGNIVNVGGSLTGGTVNRQQSSILQKRELEKVKEKLDELEQKLVREKNELLKLENDAKELAHTLLQKQMSYAKLEVVVQGKKEELVVAKGEYESLSHQSVELDEFKSGKIDNQLVLQLNEAIKHRDELTAVSYTHLKMKKIMIRITKFVMSFIEKVIKNLWYLMIMKIMLN